MGAVVIIFGVLNSCTNGVRELNMPATVITGIFSDNPVNWFQVNGAGPFDGFLVIPNTQNTTQTFTGASISSLGPGTAGSGDFVVNPGQFPVIANPGQSIIVHIAFTPSGAGARSGLLTVTTNSSYTPTVVLRGVQTIGNAPGQAFPTRVVFPPTKVGQTTTLANYQIVNLASALITVSNIALTTGTDFFLVGAPVTPFTIPSGGSSVVFSVQFTPTLVGGRNDILSVTTSGGGGLTIGDSIQGTGTTLQSAFSLTGATQGSLFAFPGAGAPLVLLADPNNLDTEEAGSFVKLHDFQIPNAEKQVMRIRGHYEDLGVANVTFTLRSRRIGQLDETTQITIPIGTVAADGWIREFTSEPRPVTGELVQLTVSRVAGSGPVSIIDYVPMFEPKGEVLGGT